MYNLPKLSYTKPTNCTFEDYGTVIEIPAHVEKFKSKDTKLPTTESPSFYIQISPQRFRSKWMELQDFFIKIFEPFLIDPTFIKDCLKMYEATNRNSRGCLVPIRRKLRDELKKLKAKEKNARLEKKRSRNNATGNSSKT